MSYAKLPDLLARYGEAELTQLADPDGAGVIDESIVDQALADAAALVDGYLAGRYPVPLDPVPAIVRGYVCDVARARLYTQDAPEPVLRREADAIRFFRMVGEGRLNLGATPEPASGNLVEVASAPRRRFGVGL